MKSALVIIDIQNDYFKGGACELVNPEQAAEQAKKVLNTFRQKSLPVFHVRHINNYPGATFHLSDTKGSEIHSLVAPLPNEKVIIKYAPSSFLHTELSKELLEQEIDHLVICGMMSHMCIDTTVRAAQDYGFKVTLIEDACTTKDLYWNGTIISAETVHNTIMASVNGVFAQVVKAEEFLKQMN
jgi:nicotinamidase-related amidase